MEAGLYETNSRSHDTNDWCHVRNSSIAFLLLAAVCSVGGVISGYCAEHKNMTYVLFINFLAVGGEF